MNNAVAGVIQLKVKKWGFAANDPRVAATFTGVGGGLTTLALGVAGGAVAAVGWPALLVTAGVAAVVTGSISLAMDSLYKWLFNSNGTISTSGGGGGNGALVKGGAYVAGSYSTAQYPAPHTKSQAEDDWQRGCKPYNQCTGTTVEASGVHQSTDSGGLPITVYAYNVMKNSNVYTSFSMTLRSTGASMSCDAGMVADKGVCVALQTGTPDGVSNASPSAAVENIPASELNKALSDQFLAAAANAAWKAASNYGGLPWTPSDPVTPADVAAWRAENPSIVPTVGDAIAPVSNGNAVVISPSNSGQPGTGPSTTPGSGTVVDLGPNPNTPAPTLESIPTAQQILSPLLGLMPDIKSFVVPSHSAACPTASFVALGRAYAIDTHCALLETNRQLIEAVMMLCWTLASVFIVLRA
ncbi:hypothetical protein [Duganella sp.]|uniref:hypothetical protein n=1 Tax=Duganella sp. TaxID=1904440 RepID=UPI0031DF7578